MKTTMIALLLLWPSVGAAGEETTGALAPVADAVAARRTGLALDPETPRKVRRALDRAERILERPRARLEKELAHAAKAFRLLDRFLPGDEVLDPIVEDALAVLTDATQAGWADIAPWRGLLATPKKNAALDRRRSKAISWMEKGLLAPRRALAAKRFAKAAKLMRKTRKRFEIEGPPVFPRAGVAPDFALTDDNPSSPTTGTGISPRDFLGQVSAWYFLEAT